MSRQSATAVVVGTSIAGEPIRLTGLLVEVADGLALRLTDGALGAQL